MGGIDCLFCCLGLVVLLGVRFVFFGLLWFWWLCIACVYFVHYLGFALSVALGGGFVCCLVDWRVGVCVLIG